MDGRGFDELTRAIAAGASRRAVVKTLAGVVAGGVATLAGVRRADAATCRTHGRLCNKNANCCSGTCCNNRCVSQNSTNPTTIVNCGACGHDCSGLEGTGIIGCVQGACVTSADFCFDDDEDGHDDFCIPGWLADCDGDGQAETTLSVPTNCAFCGNDCTVRPDGRNLCIGNGRFYTCGFEFEEQGVGGGFPFASDFD